MENKKTCLYEKHVALGALISPFGGFDMPIQYTNIVDEHQAVRQHCGVFDVSHMGEVLVSGKDAERYVNHIFTNDIRGIPNGKILYGMMCYEHGGVVDDLLVYKMADDRFFLVINASNIDKDWAWIQQQAEGFDIKLEHQSDQYGELAIQGPEAEQVMEEVLGIPCKELAFYTFKILNTNSQQPTVNSFIVSRTGYTGEDGFEIYASAEYINECWDKLIAAGIKPCGLGCRDTLRFEVGLPLYGDELSEDITPIMAGLGIFVKLDKDEFIGKEALAKQKAEGAPQKLVGIELNDKAIPRHGYAVLNMEGETIGEVTTGYHTISTDKSVCMALIDAQYAKLDTDLQIQIRKKVFPGKWSKNNSIIKTIKNKYNMAKVIEGLYYSESHEYVRVEGNFGFIGITDYAQNALGNVVYVDLPEVDDEVTAGEEFGAVESVKAASDLISPVSGTVVEVNDELDDQPELVNQDAFANWIIKVEMSDKSELDNLMDAKAYAAFCEK